MAGLKRIFELGIGGYNYEAAMIFLEEEGRNPRVWVEPGLGGVGACGCERWVIEYDWRQGDDA